MSGLDGAAAIIGIAGVEMTVAKELTDIAGAIGSAEEEVRICATDTDLFSRMLINFSTALRATTAKSGSAQHTAEDLIDRCGRVLDLFDRLISKLTTLLNNYRESEHQILQISLRFQWYFSQRSKVTFYQHAVGQLKFTLSCLLPTMNLQESRVSAPQRVL